MSSSGDRRRRAGSGDSEGGHPIDLAATGPHLHRGTRPPDDLPRVHLDLIVDSSDEQIAEVERLVSLGAHHVSWGYPIDPDFIVLSDTEGNRFCVVDASHG